MYRMYLLSAEIPRNCPVEGCRGGVGDFHLRGPNMWSVLALGACMRVREALLARFAYLVRAWKYQFLKDGKTKGLCSYRCLRRLARCHRAGTAIFVHLRYPGG